MAQLTVQQAIEQAVRLHRAGHLTQAEALYRQILAKQPDQPDALHLMGVMALNAGRSNEAVGLIGRAIAVNSSVADYHSNLGLALAKLDRVEEATAAARRALQLRPNFVECQFNLAALLHRAGKTGDAIATLRALLEQQPQMPEAWNNLGNMLSSVNQPAEAVAVYRKAIALRGDYAEAYLNLGTALIANRQLSEAISVMRHVVSLRPDHAPAYFNLANALAFDEQLAEAITNFRRAIEIRPNFAEAWNHLGIALRRNGQLAEGISAARKAMELRPDFFAATNNYANALKEFGRHDDAAQAYRRAIAIKPDSAIAHFNLGATLLLQGDFEQGWTEYEWRWNAKEYRERPRAFDKPRWDGSPLEGRRIILLAEQGFGDSIHFARYVPLVVERGGTVMLECQPQLKRLLGRLEGIDRIIGPEDPLPEFDVQCPLMSLAQVMGTRPASIPTNVPYLSAEPALIAQWKSRVGSAVSADALKVGLAWAGNPAHYNDATRSIALSAFAPLGEIPRVAFCSLQKGPAAKQAADAPAGLRLIDLTEQIDDFAETAALIANLDLVIAVDTAVAHLSAAMGKPTWLLVAFVPDWRWMLGRSDSPWYPTMRLFRQEQAGDWRGVLEWLAEALVQRAKE
jgi:tetratricopeptide (TPR) repeat protein